MVMTTPSISPLLVRFSQALFKLNCTLSEYFHDNMLGKSLAKNHLLDWQSSGYNVMGLKNNFSLEKVRNGRHIDSEWHRRIPYQARALLVMLGTLYAT
jgi:hypothetical protein